MEFISINRFKPDIIISDSRLSSIIISRIMRIKSMTILNQIKINYPVNFHAQHTIGKEQNIQFYDEQLTCLRVKIELSLFEIDHPYGYCWECTLDYIESVTRH